MVPGERMYYSVYNQAYAKTESDWVVNTWLNTNWWSEQENCFVQRK